MGWPLTTLTGRTIAFLVAPYGVEQQELTSPWQAVAESGGVANPDQLRLDRAAVSFVHACCASGRPVAAICHAAWTLIEADAVRGRTLTSWPSLRTDLVNAGAQWVDEEVHICRDGPGPLETSRKPADLPVFEDALVTEFVHAVAKRRT